MLDVVICCSLWQSIHPSTCRWGAKTQAFFHPGHWETHACGPFLCVMLAVFSSHMKWIPSMWVIVRGLHHNAHTKWTITQRSRVLPIKSTSFMQQMPCGFRSLLMMGCLWAGRKTAEWAGWPPGASRTRGEGQDVWETIRALLQFSCHKWHSGSGLDSAPAQTQCRSGCQGHKCPNSSSDNRKVCSCKTKKSNKLWIRKDGSLIWV